MNYFSQREVSKKLGISVFAYAKMERGLNDLTIKKLQQIVDLYEISFVDFLLLGEEKTSDIQINSLEKQLYDLTVKYNEQQKKLIELYEIITNHRN